MAGVETRQTPLGGDTADPPGAAERLDEWFTRRLEAQGIPLSGRRLPTARILAVAGLGAALLGLFWALSGAGGKTTAAPVASNPTTQPTTPTTTGGGPKTKPATQPISWRSVKVDVLNGYGGSGAATTAATALQAAGWKVGTTGDVGTSATRTYVVYAKGHWAQARAVAAKLGLGPPIPIASASGIPPGATTGVAIVLGPSGLPSA
jgi:hypothetical protein